MGPIGVGWSPSFSGRQGGSRTPTRAPCGGAGPVGGAGRAGSSLGAEVPAFDVGLAPACGASGGGREGGATPPRYYLGRRGARREPRPERTRGGGFRPESAARQPCCDRRRAAVGIPGLGHFPGFPGSRPWASPSPTRAPQGSALGGAEGAWAVPRRVPAVSAPSMGEGAQGPAFVTSPGHCRGFCLGDFPIAAGKSH